MLRLIRFYAIQHEGVIPLRLLQIELKHMMLKHPLNSKWTLWFYKNESRNWEENQRQVGLKIYNSKKLQAIFSILAVSR